ncbi:MAG: NTP transferase domain-containing protein [Myxococcales bacterium]|nr:NTP transferase domain-containing protein [Myxococcales bacterium]
MPKAGKIHAVILAGGAGERFWPASRAKHPKPLLEVVDGQSLLDATAARARRFASKGCVWVVCGADHAAAIRRSTGLPPSRVLVEPMRRNTAMAVALAAQRIATADPEGVMAVLPADHRIPDVKRFASEIKRAAVAAAAAGVLVTLGVEPTRADTGYGYINIGRAAGADHPGLSHVRRFIEKPNAAAARRYLKHGGYLWNAGIFVFSARTILEEIEACEPALFKALAPLKKAGKRLTKAALLAAYRKAPSMPIDVAVMERSKKVWTLPVSFHWSDVGTWQSLAEELGVTDGLSKVVEGDLAHDDIGGNLVWTTNHGGHARTVALLGVEGLAVIDTGDVLLVARLDRAADVRDIVKKLKANGRANVT